MKPSSLCAPVARVLLRRLAAIAAIAPFASAQCATQWLPGDGIPGVADDVHAMVT